MVRFLCLIPLAMLSACATIVTGFDQTVAISTTPPGATCVLDRLGDRVGSIPATPGIASVSKSRYDLSVTCSKDGFLTARMVHSSQFNGVTFGNVILGGVVGAVVDASSGANYNYPRSIGIELVAVPVSGIGGSTGAGPGRRTQIGQIAAPTS